MYIYRRNVPKPNSFTMNQNLVTKLFYGNALGGIFKGLLWATVLIGLGIYIQDALSQTVGGSAIVLITAAILGVCCILIGVAVTEARKYESTDGQSWYSAGDFLFGGYLNAAIWFIYLTCLTSGVAVGLADERSPRTAVLWGGLFSLVTVAVIYLIRYKTGALRAKKAVDEQIAAKKAAPTETAQKVAQPSLRDQLAAKAEPSAGRDFPVTPSQGTNGYRKPNSSL